MFYGQGLQHSLYVSTSMNSLKIFKIQTQSLFVFPIVVTKRARLTCIVKVVRTQEQIICMPSYLFTLSLNS